jgi:hypothetical protein
MKDINLVYNEIVEKLKASNNYSVVGDLEHMISSAATGGEALSSSAFYLKHLIEKDPGAYQLIREQVNQYLDYCKKNGLIIN